jgi:very-short-patch-repair endonuclease
VIREVEDRIAAAAARQHGVVTRRQLIDAGLSASAVSRRLAAGRLRSIHAGIYLVGPLLPPRALEMAAVLASAPGGVLSHLSAASLWGLRAVRGGAAEKRFAGAGVEPIDVMIAVSNRARRPGIRVHRVARLDDMDRTIHDAIPITTPARTLLDLARVVGTRDLENAVARAEREGLVSRDALTALVARHPHRPGTPALRAVLAAGGGPALTRSEAEAKFLALVRTAGLPIPEANVSVGRYEIDFLWRSAGIAVEVDGFQHHSSRPRFEGDRRKDARLLAAGIHVVRLSWRQIADEAIPTAVQVGQALARAAVVRGERPQGRVPAPRHSASRRSDGTGQRARQSDLLQLLQPPGRK